MLDINLHKTHLLQILLAIYKDSYLAANLGFKGGTAAYLFHKLPGFSTDLDFDLITGERKVISERLEKTEERLGKILRAKYQIKDVRRKRETLFWLVSYQPRRTQIKVEVSTRDYPNNYERRAFYGTTVQLLKIGDMMAHKLVAVEDRKKPANRDLFDAHFFLSSPEVVEINYELVKLRTGLGRREFYQSMLRHLDKVSNRAILAGLGEVLSQSQKDWAKAKLLSELKQLVRLQMEVAA